MTWHTISVRLKELETIKPFTEPEAWGVFRLAALSEAVGWTILILGIGIRHYHLPGSAYAVPIAGRVHGTIFLAYFAALFATFTSLEWSHKKSLAALLAGVPPYGTLLFELWAARRRHHKQLRIHFRATALVVLAARA